MTKLSQEYDCKRTGRPPKDDPHETRDRSIAAGSQVDPGLGAQQGAWGQYCAKPKHAEAHTQVQMYIPAN